jgi:hypothetical protein
MMAAVGLGGLPEAKRGRARRTCTKAWKHPTGSRRRGFRATISEHRKSTEALYRGAPMPTVYPRRSKISRRLQTRWSASSGER